MNQRRTGVRLLAFCASLMLLAGTVLAAYGPLPLHAEGETKTVWLDEVEPASFQTLPGELYVNMNPQGGAISIGNTEYEHGILVHPLEGGQPAELIYKVENLGYKSFSAIIGKDLYSGIEVGGALGILETSISAEIYTDGTKVAESGPLPYPEVFPVKVDLTGVKELRIVVTDGGDGLFCDTTAIANARLSALGVDEIPDDWTAVAPSDSPEETPAPATPDPALKDADRAFISDLPWYNLRSYSETGEPEELRDENYALEELWICGEYFEKGVFLHALPTVESSVEVNLEGLGFTTFAAYVGLAESAQYDVSMGSVTFAVYVDGEQKAHTEVMRADSEAQLLVVDITGAKVLRLAVGNGGDSYQGDWGVFGNALVGRTSDTAELFKSPEPSQTPEPSETPAPSLTPAPATGSAGNGTPAASPKPGTDAADSSEKAGLSGALRWIVPVAAVVAVAVLAAVIAVCVKKKRRKNQ